MTLHRVEARLCIAATLALAAGVLVYLCARGSQPLPALLRLGTGSLPTFLHTSAFTLLSLAVVAPWPRLGLATCAAWFLLESAFEALQIPTLAGLMHLQAITASSPLWDSYLRGTFDPLDILAAAAGASLAGWIAVRTRALAPERAA
jgi:hypothetical protein